MFGYVRLRTSRHVLALAAFLPVLAVAASHAYVANAGDGTVSVIDTQSDEVMRTLIVHGESGDKLQAAVADRSEKTLFVVDALSGKLVIVDLANGQVKARIGIGKNPAGVSLSASGEQIAVCVAGENKVELIDVATGKTANTIPTQGKDPEYCQFSNDGHWLLTSNGKSNDVDIIDVSAGRSIAEVPAGGHPRGIAIPNDHLAYVVQEASGGIDVIDLAQRKVVKSIATGAHPDEVVVSADGKRAYVANAGADTVSVIDTAEGKVVANFPVGKRAGSMALSHDGKKLYVTNSDSENVIVFDTASVKQVKEIAVGELPAGVQIP
jgi:YVTN family beta-propeller protein